MQRHYQASCHATIRRAYFLPSVIHAFQYLRALIVNRSILNSLILRYV
ncbi:hypothetical protein BN1221_03040c [Brenneria goodwinii]|uniref:Uncharacterized protein n=1 Tax=Brenneria goodwinii TaxID=1109412 RepID=A0A0G4JXG8_9GAMM|nr:hypothetical protein BN1221_03040c [Brenneria goodwinii]